MKIVAKSLFFVLLSVTACFGQNVQSIKPPQITFQSYTLANGLKVILHEDHRLSVVAVNLWYHVGADREIDGRAGFAHLFEHMMFEGSTHAGATARFSTLQSVGATNINATTSFDRTNYYETVPANQLETALWLESDSMGFFSDALSHTLLAKQKDIVRNERRQHNEGQPYQLGEEAIYKLLFPVGHPYRADIMGSHAEIESARLAEIRAFHDAYYTPNNATLALAGDFDSVSVRKMIEKYFATLPAGPKLSPTQITTPAITVERRAVVPDAVEVPQVSFGWLMPPIFAEGSAEANLLAIILGDGPSSRFQRILVRDKKLARSAECENMSQTQASIFTCNLQAGPGVDAHSLEVAAGQVIDDFMRDGPTVAELEAARNRIQTDQMLHLQSLGAGTEQIGGMGGIANQLNYYNQYIGDPGYFSKDFARYNAVTVSGLRRFAQNALAQKHRAVVYTVPGKKQIEDVPRSPDSLDAYQHFAPAHSPEFERAESWRYTHPAVAATLVPSLPVPVMFTLPNGLTVYFMERHNVPVVSMQLTTLAGADSAENAQFGLPHLVASLLPLGTTDSSADQILNQVALLGGELKADSDMNSSQLSLTLLTDKAERGLSLLADVVQHPTFSQSGFEQARTSQLAELEQLADSPRQRIQQLALHELFVGSGPYAYGILGSEDALQKLNCDDATRFYELHYSPKNSLLELSGDLTLAQAKDLATRHFGSWNNTAASTATPQHQPFTMQRTVLINQPGAVQTALVAAGFGPVRNSPDYATAMVMNNAFGGLFTARLNTNLREKHGYTYLAFSAFQFYRDASPFLARMVVRSDVTVPATQQLIAEIRGATEHPFTPEELRKAKDALLLAMPADFEDVRDLNKQMATLWLFHLPRNSYQSYAVQVAGVSSDDVQKAVAKYLDPKTLQLVALGDTGKIADGMKLLDWGETVTRQNITYKTR